MYMNIYMYVTAQCTVHTCVYVHVCVYLQENNRLRDDMMMLEKSVTERIGYLQRHKVLYKV